ncbi:MAG: hypothetical protein AAFQ82_22725, partial [Myxococcota bacterium]
MLTALALSMALSAPTDVIVYELEADGFNEHQRRLAEFGVLKEIQKRKGLLASSIEDARERAGYREESGCDPRDCLARLVDSIGSDLVVTGRITRLGDSTAIALRVVDLRERSVV